MKALTLAICLLLSSVSAAELEVGIFTHHLISKGLNENNKFIGGEYKGIEVSTFVNSYHDQSYSIGYRYNVTDRVAVSGGFINGYGDNSKNFPITINDTVVYGAVSYTHPIKGMLKVRARQTWEVTLISWVLDF